MSFRRNTFWDRLGMSMSAACIIHCLLVPVLLSLLPLSSLAYSLHEWAHPVLLALIIPSVFFSFSSRRGLLKGAIFLILGLTLLVLAWGAHGWSVWLAETLLTIGGSISLVTGHWLNYRSHKMHASVRSASKYTM